jgi:hypothetical protein
VKQNNAQNADKCCQEDGREVRARCWAYIFACFAAKKTAEQSSHDDGKKDEDVGAERTLPKK